MVSQDGENRPVLGASTKDAGSDSGVEEDVSFNVEGPVTHDHLVDLIESPAWKVLLFQIVDAERLDPWDIDIVKLSDSYLKKINAMNEFSFHLPANAILAASIFLAFKSRKVNLSLLLPQAQDELAGFIESDLLDLAMGADPSVVLEPEITAPLKRVPQNRVTLEELVNAVQLIMDRKKIQKPKLDQAQHVESLFSNLRVSGIDINQQISRTYSNISSLADSQGLVRFSELVKPDIELAKRKGANGDSERVGILMNFLPVLHLMVQQKVKVWQDVFFGEIFIQVGKEGQATAAQEGGPGLNISGAG